MRKPENCLKLKADRALVADKRETIYQHEAEKNEKIAKLREPVNELEHKRWTIERNKPESESAWALGCLLSVVWFIFSCVMVAEKGWDRSDTFNSWLIAPLIFSGIIRLIQEVWHAIKLGSVEQKIGAKEREIDPLKKKLEEEHKVVRVRLDKELRELERLLKIANRDNTFESLSWNQQGLRLNRKALHGDWLVQITPRLRIGFAPRK
ncbi:MAG TPA: hypothetical protein VNM72_10355 [Blastocatellia bacterium]|nr:hypothetical protein [Blastocatellia bacterium]